MITYKTLPVKTTTTVNLKTPKILRLLIGGRKYVFISIVSMWMRINNPRI